MTLLDQLSGYEFEDAVASLFRAHGYDDVQVATRVADEGRDVTMYDGETGYVVECKHTDVVSRPDVQKLHSAIATFDHDGPKRGKAVTSGRFTGPAEEYADRLRETGDPYPIELVDGEALRRLGEDVGMDLYNGRIEIVCEEALPVGDPERVVADVFEDVENAPGRDDLPPTETDVRYLPVVDVEAVTRRTFETSVGVIHTVDSRDRVVVEAGRDGPGVAPNDLAALVAVESVALDDAGGDHDGEVPRFARTEAEYREWATGAICDALETTVSYTGDNNVTYTRECRPSPSDVDVRRSRPLYVPRVEAAVVLGEYTHRYEYAAAGERVAARTDGVRRCVHCPTAGATGATYTFCENCGSVSCESHTRTEQVTGDPVCTGCAVTGSFLLSTKYFFDDANLAAFREEYESMPFYRKPLVNPRLVAAAAAGVLLLLGLAVAAL